MKCRNCGKPFNCKGICNSRRTKLDKCLCPNCWIKENGKLVGCLEVEQLTVREQVEFT